MIMGELKINNFNYLFLSIFFCLASFVVNPLTSSAADHQVISVSLEKGVYKDIKIPKAPSDFSKC